MINEIDPLITHAYRMDETKCVEALILEASLPEDCLVRIREKAQVLMRNLREHRLKSKSLDAFLYTYDLSSEEGVALMCLAEALLRIPDPRTRDQLIKDKLSNRDWNKHLSKKHTWFVNAATKALAWTGKILEKEILNGMVNRLGEPVIRQAVTQAMTMLGAQFVMGETIQKAIKRAKNQEKKGYCYSYDMLGEAARTAEDAERYFLAYTQAIQAIAEVGGGLGTIKSPGISVKLSALHPRYKLEKHQKILIELYPKLKALVAQAKAANVGLTLDAEEANRLELSLLLFKKLVEDPNLGNWQGLGIAVQAYQKRASFVIDWLITLARTTKRRFAIRLVKGAYWDSEIKWAQEGGFKGYPVFTRKCATDVSYVVCLKKLLAARDAIYPQFATHNAYTVATVLELAGHARDFEFQCLHGMGDALYDPLLADTSLNLTCRIYAPVGGHEYLLAYLVRRLLENGANSSFVNRILHEENSIEELMTDPVLAIKSLTQIPHPKIPLPQNLFGEERPNSRGLDLTDNSEIYPVLEEIKQFQPTILEKPMVSVSLDQMKLLILNSVKAALTWNKVSILTRTECLERMAVLLEEHRSELMALLIREGGKTVQDAASEVREAIDYCWYYSVRCGIDFKKNVLPGPTGEYNQLALHARGTIACISPWNFPLAIFLGQVTAALAAGNTVIAKPASQTPLIAARAVELLHEAGFPKDAVQLLVGRGSLLGEHFMQDPNIQGVMFTGSTDTARGIHQQLAARVGPIIPFIAETGGQNVMIVDSSALAEQVVEDIIASAFNSAGQRCSALRILFIQQEAAVSILPMLKGAMMELEIGDPLHLSTDIGPVIDKQAVAQLKQHVERMDKEAELIFACPLPENLPILPRGEFFAPCAYQINDIKMLTEEVFGPILHVIQFESENLDQVITMINTMGYGLTLGIHSRIDDKVQYIVDNVHVGNTYVNRNMIGAVVGVHPFGGEGLSGTGPKAGGPHMLPRLAVERTLSVNTTASGGNVTLMSLKES